MEDVNVDPKDASHVLGMSWGYNGIAVLPESVGRNGQGCRLLTQEMRAIADRQSTHHSDMERHCLLR
jgi:hypothetical protein